MSLALRLPSLSAMAHNPGWQGFGTLNVVSKSEFWREADLPFELHGGGAVVRLVPERGFAKESLAGSPDERLVILDCPDDDGWLVPAGLVTDWMSRNVACPPLDDLLLSHPLYSYATRVDSRGRSRMGKARLAHWAPGIPTVAAITAPEWLPRDADAPRVHRDRAQHVAAVEDLVGQLDDTFGLLEVEIGSRIAHAKVVGRAAADEPAQATL